MHENTNSGGVIYSMNPNKTNIADEARRAANAAPLIREIKTSLKLSFIMLPTQSCCRSQGSLIQASRDTPETFRPEQKSVLVSIKSGNAEPDLFSSLCSPCFLSLTCCQQKCFLCGFIRASHPFFFKQIFAYQNHRDNNPLMQTR